MNDKKYFRIVSFAIAVAFAFTCFSIIFCITNSSSVEEAQNSSHVMSIVYMIFHLFIEAVVFYYSFKAMVNGSSLIKNVMYVQDNVPNKKCKRNALIMFIVFSILFVYMGLIIFPINIFLSFFALGLKFALANFSLLVAIISLSFYLYPKEK